VCEHGRGGMIAQVYDRLSANARDLVDQIEKRVGYEIEVKSVGERDPHQKVAEAIGESVVGVLTGPTAITIESPGPITDITEEDYVHELLHLHRSYLLEIPHLYAKTQANLNAGAAIDNWLEHFIIYEKQLELCPDFQEKLDTGLADFWTKCPWGMGGSTFKLNLLTRYLITRRYCSSETKKIMSDVIQKQELPYSIRDVAKRCEKLTGDKTAFVESALNFFDIPKTLFWLRRYDAVHRKAVWWDF
jgi:hypothetical protein